MLLLIEQLPQLVAEQVEAVQNLKIDKITVWDTAGSASNGGRNATADFLSGLIGTLPKLHELAQQADIELPPMLGKVMQDVPTSRMAGLDSAAKTTNTKA